MSFWRILATVLLGAGVVLELLAVLGLACMRDTYDRLHYVGLASVGALLIGLAVLARESFSLIGDKALVTGAVLVLLGPVLVHATARSIRIRERGQWDAGLGEPDAGREP